MGSTGLMRCGATMISSTPKSNVGAMTCGATPILSEEDLKAREDKKAAFLAEEAKKEKNKTKEVEEELESVKLEDKHAFTLKKEAIAKGYTGDKFDKKSLITFLETNQ